MKVLVKQLLRGFPKSTHLQTQKKIKCWKYRAILLVLFSIPSLFLSAQWVTHIECPCNMFPSISVAEYSGLEEHDRLICRGDAVTITANGGYKYEWSTGDTINTITVNQAGGYNVTISDAEGCQVVENVLITEYSKPYIDYDDAFCTDNASIKVIGRNVQSIWSDGSTNNYLNVAQSGTYHVTITDENRCAYVESATLSIDTSSTVDILVKNNAGQPIDHTICKGKVIDLHATTGFTSYHWSSSDGTINASGATLIVHPTATATYTVVATDGSGCTSTKSVTIVVNKLHPTISPDVTICDGSTTQLNATGGITYSWSPTTGLSDPTISNPIAAPTVTTTYSVMITNDEGCSTTNAVTVTVEDLPVFVSPSKEICLGSSTLLIASGGSSYTWSPATGLSDPTIANPVASPIETTSYTVVITNEQGCSETRTVTVGVFDTPTGVGPDTLICLGGAITLSATGGDHYAWTPSMTLNDTSISNPIATPDATTTYTVSITDIHGCLSVQTQTVEVASSSVEIVGEMLICLGDTTTLRAIPTSIFTGSTYTYLWSNNSADETISVSPDSSTTYFVSITDTNGCTAVDSMVVTVNDYQVEAGPNLLICLGDSVQLQSFYTLNGTEISDGSIQYAWSPNTGISDASTASPTVSPSTATTYAVTITDANGCTAVDSILVSVNDLQVEAGTDRLICLGDRLQLSPTYTLNGLPITGSGTSVTFAWSPAQGVSDPTISNPTVSPSDSTVYTVIVTDANGCTATDSVLVSVNDLQVELGMDQIICPGDSIDLIPTLTLNGNLFTGTGSSVSFTWTPSVEDSTSLTPTVVPDITTTYVLNIVDDNGCTAVDSIQIEVHPKISPRLGTLPTKINYIESLDFIYRQSSSVPIVQYIWTPTDYLDCPNDPQLNCSEPTFTDILAVDSIYTYRLTVIDTNGCRDFEEVDVNVNINNEPLLPEMATISGTVYTENGKKVEEGMIHLIGAGTQPSMTDQFGNFEFDNIPMYEQYTVKPEKEEHPLNGVTTADLILINKHILGVKKLGSPYKIIAADVNNSGAVTIYDVVELRKLILNDVLYFSNNFSWRFVDASYQFKSPTRPLQEDFPDVRSIEDLADNMEQLNFIAVKIGDVNSSAIPNSLTTTESRTHRDVFKWKIQQTVHADQEIVTYDFYPQDFKEIEGYQFSIDFDAKQLDFEKIIPSALIEENNFGWRELNRGVITTSWNRQAEMVLDTETALFSLVFQLKEQTAILSGLKIASTGIVSEAYGKQGELLSVEAIHQTAPSLPLETGLTLYQNEPNPFTGQTLIGFHLPKANKAAIKIFNAIGEEVKVYSGLYNKGYNSIIVKSQELSAYGALYYQLSTDEEIVTKKMIHLK